MLETVAQEGVEAECEGAEEQEEDPAASAEEDLRMTMEESTAEKIRIRGHQHPGREQESPVSLESPENQEKGHLGRIVRVVLSVTTGEMIIEEMKSPER